MAFNSALHPRGPNGRFTRSYARHMNSLDGVKAKKVKTGFKARVFKGADDARAYLSKHFGSKGGKGGGGGIGQHVASGALGRANETLRAGKTGPEVQVIDREMKPLPDSLDLYRSVPAKKFGQVDPKSLEGMVVSDAGYFPATVAPTKPVSGNVRMHIQAPAGTPAAVDPDTGQVVLGHGAQMAVDSVDVTPDGSTLMDLVVLPDDGGGDLVEAPDPPEPVLPQPPTPSATAPHPLAAPASFEDRFDNASSGLEVLDSTDRSLVRSETLTPEQREGLYAYGGDDYQAINHVLRGGSQASLAENYPDVSREDIDRWTAGVDSAMEQSRLPQESAVYRGMDATRLFGDAFDGDMTGLEWTEGGYASTSTDPAVSRTFAGRGHGSTMMNVLVPAGIGGVEISDDGSSGENQFDESELLLERGLTFRIVADHGFGDDGTRWLDVEVVPRGS